jgi:hypothetical protein
MFLELCILGAFDSLPTNVFGLFVPTLTAFSKKKVLNNKPLPLDANYATGFLDGEANFTVTISKRDRSDLG